MTFEQWYNSLQAEDRPDYGDAKMVWEEAYQEGYAEGYSQGVADE